MNKDFFSVCRILMLTQWDFHLVRRQESLIDFETKVLRHIRFVFQPANDLSHDCEMTSTPKAESSESNGYTV